MGGAFPSLARRLRKQTQSWRWPQLATINTFSTYTPGPIAPVVKAGQNLGILTQGVYRFFRVLFIEGIPPSPETTQNLGAVTAAAASAATEITVVQAQEGNLIQARMAPMDDFEAQVSQVRAAGRFSTFTQQARVTPYIAGVDPHYATTTTFILGNTRSLFITAHNNTDYNLAQTRIRFWGYRYVLDRLTTAQEVALQKTVLNMDMTPEEAALVSKLRVTLVPAEGREV